MITLGISCFYHDAAACIVKDGKVLAAAAEERFSRIKHDNSFPYRAVVYCLDYLGIAINEVDEIAFYEKPILKFDRLLHQHIAYFPRGRKTFVGSIGSWINEKLNIEKILREKFNFVGKIAYIPHHLSHAASSYYLSGFKESAIVTIDGVGEWATTTRGVGKGWEIKIEKEIRFPHSLGLLYSSITAYLGFKVNNDEYKVMGLAAYGDAKQFKAKMDELISLFADGSYALKMEYFDFGWSDHMFSKKLEQLFGYPAREPESKIYGYHEDIAAALQQKLEEAVFNLFSATYRKYGTKNLCYAGGVALNSTLNGKIVKETKFSKIYIPLDPGDGGGAMGAALYIQRQNGLVDVKKFTPYLGPGYSGLEVEKALRENKLKFKYYAKKEVMLSDVSKLLEEDKVIGWYQGKMEWGPRALGNRSILASAAKPEMKDIINLKVKKREMFRPFAPVILEEFVDDYFVAGKQPMVLGKYMLLVLPFRKKGLEKAPATVHVNNTGRLQVIAREDNPLYYDLVKEYWKKTGIPMIINTSFNVRGEPIVCTPDEAIACFLKTDIDALVADRYLVIKRGKTDGKTAD